MKRRKLKSCEREGKMKKDEKDNERRTSIMEGK
jgi:hypothetical protein